MSQTTKIVVGVAVFVAVAYGIYVFVGKTGKGLGIGKLIQRPSQPKPGDELRTGLTGNNVAPTPTDAELFKGMLSGGTKLKLDNDLELLMSGPYNTGADGAYGPINGGALVNKGSLPVDKEGVIMYGLEDFA